MTRNRDTAFFGHPIGLLTLFLTEMWERFSYYGGRALLILYMTAAVTAGGRGMTVTAAGLVMALYLSSVYLLSLPGGWIADRFVGQRAAVTIGGLGIAAGNVMLAVPIDGLFFPGLVMIALGTGMLKPNISTIVGQLYTADDTRRDSGYTIYYMGINIGAFFAPIACGFLAQSTTFRGFMQSHGIDPNWCWHFGFGAAAIGMVLGVVQYLFSQRLLGESGKHPTMPSDPARAARDRKVLGGIVAALVVILGLFAIGSTTDAIAISAGTITDIFGIGLVIGSVVLFYGLVRSARDAGERKRIIAMIPLFIGAVAFFGVFEQASTTLSVFADKHTAPTLAGFNFPASYYQSVNSLYIITFLAPAFAWLWLKLGRARKEPSSVMKFSIGMALAAASFAVMVPSLGTIASGGKVSGGFLIVLYFFSTCSELCISPVGLSSMSKLAPTRLAGMVMGTWFLAAANGNYLAGRAAGFAEQRGFAFLFYFLIAASLIVAAGLFVVSPIIRRMLGTEAPVPADRTEKAEPEPLPGARVIKSGD